jgi:hypothetical protein
VAPNGFAATSKYHASEESHKASSVMGTYKYWKSPGIIAAWATWRLGHAHPWLQSHQRRCSILTTKSTYCSPSAQRLSERTVQHSEDSEFSEAFRPVDWKSLQTLKESIRLSGTQIHHNNARSYQKTRRHSAEDSNLPTTK